MIASVALAMAGVFAAAVLRGFTGYGFGLAAVPLLSLALPPARVVPLVVALQAIIGVAGLRSAWIACDWGAVGVLAPGLVLGIPLGLLILTALPPNPVRLAIGVIIAFSVWVIRRGFRLPPNPPRLLGGSVGLISGIISGLASMGGPPVIVYFLALGHGAARMRATAIVYFMLAACVSLIPMAAKGMITGDTLVWTVACVPVLLLGSALGSRAFRRAQPWHHRMVALTTLSALAVLLIVRAVLGHSDG
ncbi:MAG: sulfite exporter TauE/SafE family protein [Rhodopila sp.]